MKDLVEMVSTVGLFVFVSAVAGLLGISIGVSEGVSRIREQAVNAGVAEYRCDNGTGDVEFVFKSPGELREGGSE